MVDGPFGSASEDFLNYETVLLVGAAPSPTRLSKVYFVWVIRDFGSAEWFHSLLHAIEEQGVGGRIEISIYLTAKLKDDDVNNIVVQDTITSLRAPTHFGRPNWDRVFSGFAERHPETDVGVFFCGDPLVLSRNFVPKL
ncbi:hypothetical protein M407DRAFT_33389 [Tulasnella calospora MUT 4182]|uniref:Ferric reductase NAD binding domain-containing protein n=1 Tax=Tulasnella calospora MUT 4182 TaxID=1051891 RepID=A0A0C3Q344_9AGAM|nr:hypothetical protein M407DRAFT_33389 [Tulasnella calospora MUT 4182]